MLLVDLAERTGSGIGPIDDRKSGEGNRLDGDGSDGSGGLGSSTAFKIGKWLFVEPFLHHRSRLVIASWQRAASPQAANTSSSRNTSGMIGRSDQMAVTRVMFALCAREQL